MLKKYCKRVKGMLALLLLVGGIYAEYTPDSHISDEEMLDSLEKKTDSLDDRAESTVVDGGSSPIEFQGLAQLITNLYRYNNLPDKSYLSYDRQNLEIGGGNHVIAINMKVNPGRNTEMWANFGLRGSFHGFTMNKPDYAQSHHYEDKGPGVDESMSAGIALRTKLASFMLNGGSINWEEASPLSVWKGQPRMFAWTYLPYELEDPIKSFYDYNIAKGFREGRSAWHKKPFQGIRFKSEKMPGNMDFLFMYGAGNPTTKMYRRHLDAAVDLDYAADEANPQFIAEGYGDSYHKNLFYRLAKTFRTDGVSGTVGFNNGYTQITDDYKNIETYNSEAFDNHFMQFNRLFQFGKFNSTWKTFDENGNKNVVKVTDSETEEAVYEDADSISAIDLGAGYWVKPRVFSVDGKFSNDKNMSWTFDLGVTYDDTTKVTVDPSTAVTSLGLKGANTSQLSVEDAVGYLNRGIVSQDDFFATPITIGSKESVKSDPALATYGTFNYYNEDSTFVLDVEGIYAGEGYNSPYSFVATHDYYYAMGSNLVGSQAFINSSEASPYSQNTAGGFISVSPVIPSWYGHLKFKYGYNTQLSEMRDILFFPYRLNGPELNASLMSSYARYGMGEMTAPLGYDDEPDSDDYPNANEYVGRLGDESYHGPNLEGGSPSSGGLRGDYMTSYEGFVPYSDPAMAALNLLSGSADPGFKRDLSDIWQGDGFGNALASEANLEIGGKKVTFNPASVPVIENNDTTFYRFTSVNNSDSLEIARFGGVNGDGEMEDSLGAERIADTSSTGFVPASTKNSFDFAFDWGLDISDYVNYKNYLFMSLYYEINGVTKKGFAPFAPKTSDEDVLLVSHYLRSEPAIGFNNNSFFIVGLFGLERWKSEKGWVITNDGALQKSDIVMTDMAFGGGFDWDVMEHVSFHGRYKHYTHEDENVSFNNYTGNHFKFEVKAFF
ncbi:MAG: hypothetical protein ACQEQV_06160 [Fibrobacterota bacterium]